MARSSSWCRQPARRRLRPGDGQGNLDRARPGAGRPPDADRRPGQHPLPRRLDRRRRRQRALRRAHLGRHARQARRQQERHAGTRRVSGRAAQGPVPHFDATRTAMSRRRSTISCAASSTRRTNRIIAIKPGGQGDVTETHVLWEQRKHLPVVPSPLLLRGPSVPDQEPRHPDDAGAADRQADQAGTAAERRRRLLQFAGRRRRQGLPAQSARPADRGECRGRVEGAAPGRASTRTSMRRRRWSRAGFTCERPGICIVLERSPDWPFT